MTQSCAQVHTEIPLALNLGESCPQTSKSVELSESSVKAGLQVRLTLLLPGALADIQAVMGPGHTVALSQ